MWLAGSLYVQKTFGINLVYNEVVHSWKNVYSKHICQNIKSWLQVHNMGLGVFEKVWKIIIFSFTSAAVWVLNLFSQSFSIPCVRKAVLLLDLGPNYLFIYLFISFAIILLKVKVQYIPLFVLNVLTSGSLSPCLLTANSFTSYSASYSRPVIS